MGLDFCSGCYIKLVRFHKPVLINIRCAAVEVVSNFNRYQKKLHWKMTSKMFAVIFTFALVMAYAAAEIRKFVKVFATYLYLLCAVDVFTMLQKKFVILFEAQHFG